MACGMTASKSANGIKSLQQLLRSCLGLRFLFLLGGSRLQLKRMNPTFLRKLVLEQCVDHPVAGWLHFAFERVGDDVDSERNVSEN